MKGDDQLEMTEAEWALRSKAIVDAQMKVINKHIPNATVLQLSLIHEEFFKQMIGPSGAEQIKEKRNGKSTQIHTDSRPGR